MSCYVCDVKLPIILRKIVNVCVYYVYIIIYMLHISIVTEIDTTQAAKRIKELESKLKQVTQKVHIILFILE